MGCSPHSQAPATGVNQCAYRRNQGWLGKVSRPNCAVDVELTNMDSNHRSPKTVLYVEDSADDFSLFELASRKCGTPFSLQHASDGEEALAYLSGTGPYANRDEFPFPDLVLLDLKLPRLDGFEVLNWIRKNPPTRTLPVVVLAGSSFRADIRRALELGANSYAAKPAKFEELVVLIDQIADVWLAEEKVAG